jgi:hypothetical protein
MHLGITLENAENWNKQNASLKAEGNVALIVSEKHI